MLCFPSEVRGNLAAKVIVLSRNNLFINESHKSFDKNEVGTKEQQQPIFITERQDDNFHC